MKSSTKAAFQAETIAVIMASYGNIVYTSNAKRWADIILWPVSLLWWKSRKCVMFSAGSWTEAQCHGIDFLTTCFSPSM